MLFALFGVLCTRSKLYDELSLSVPNSGSFIVTSTSNTSSNSGLGHNHHIKAGKIKLLVQMPCFKFVVGVLSLCGIVAYSVFANMCYYKLNCEEIHPYIVFVPVRC